MTTAVSESLRSSPGPSRPVAALAGLVIVTVSLVAGCKSPKQKATEVIEEAYQECRKADGDFHQVELFAGSDSTEVLARTCREEMGEVVVEKGHSATAKIGPYTWGAGIDESTGIWVLKGVDWETLDQAQNRLRREDPGENELRRAIELLGQAQETYPKSGWIRLKRLETLLRLRKKTRSAKTEKGYQLGAETEDHFDETIEWARSEGDRETEARVRLQVVEYLRDYARVIEDAESALGSQDEYFEKSIEVAEEKGNDEEAEQYRKELEQMRETRPDKRELYDELIEQSRTEMCGRLSHLKTDGIEESNLTKRVESTKESIDCRALLGDGDGEGDEESDGN